MPVSNKSNLEEHINLRVRILLQDSRILIGLCKAVDKHMNFVLDDCVEITKVRTGANKQVETEKLRQLGFVLLRGRTIVSVIKEVPPSLIHFEPPGVPSRGPGTSHTAAVGALPNGPQSSASVVAHARTSQMRMAAEGRESTPKKIRPVAEEAVKEKKDVADLTSSLMDAGNIEQEPEMLRQTPNGDNSQ